LNVIGAVGHMMQSGAVAIDKTAHRGIRCERTQQLDVALADPEQYRLDPLVLEGLPVLDRHSEALRVERHCLVEIVDGHTHVINSPEQGREGYFRGGSCPLAASAAAMPAGPGSRLLTTSDPGRSALLPR
jgi:hypothetical protein